MSLRFYELMKHKYESTKPIRGRAIDIRPWGDRRRDKEQIVQYTRALDGVTMYAAKLYETNVISVAPDGNIYFDNGGWVSPSTTDFMNVVLKEFMHEIGHMYVVRREGAMWMARTQDHAYRKISKEFGLELTFDPKTGKYDAPLTTVTKKSVNRKAIKEVRNGIAKFSQFYKMFLKMSGGMVSAETMAQFSIGDIRPWGTYVAGFSVPYEGEQVELLYGGYPRTRASTEINGNDAEKILTMMRSDDGTTHLALLCALTSVANKSECGVAHVVKTINDVEIQRRDFQLEIRDIEYVVTSLIKRYADVWVYEEVTVTEPTKDHG
jgi:hypothetical protein